MTDPLSDKQIDQLIADYLADTLSEADRVIFEGWLRASPETPRRVARLSATDYALREVCQDTKADYLLDVLKQIDEAAGPANVVTLHTIKPSAWDRYRLPMVIGAGTSASSALAALMIPACPQPESCSSPTCERPRMMTSTSSSPTRGAR